MRGGQRGARVAESVPRQAADCTTPEPPGRTGTSAARYCGHERQPVKRAVSRVEPWSLLDFTPGNLQG